MSSRSLSWSAFVEDEVVDEEDDDEMDAVDIFRDIRAVVEVVAVRCCGDSVFSRAWLFMLRLALLPLESLVGVE